MAGEPPAMTGSPALTGSTVLTRSPSVTTGSAALTSAPPAPARVAPLDLWHRDTLTGDWGGLRTFLADKGVTFTASYIGEVFANTQGGLRRGATYDGLFLPQVDFDLEKLLGWQGATFQISMLQAHGPAIATRYVGNLTGISTIAALPSMTRLYNFWLDQKLLHETLSIRVGLITV